jgi:hypothetical protein
MSLKLSYHQEQDYLIVKIAGRWTTENAKQAFEASRDETTKRGLTRILIDVMEISKPGTEMTRFDTGVYFAKILGFPYKSAILVSPEVYNGFAETVALNRCAQLKAFFEPEGALAWLLGVSNESEAATLDSAPDPKES